MSLIKSLYFNLSDVLGLEMKSALAKPRAFGSFDRLQGLQPSVGPELAASEHVRAELDKIQFISNF